MSLRSRLFNCNEDLYLGVNKGVDSKFCINITLIKQKQHRKISNYYAHNEFTNN